MYSALSIARYVIGYCKQQGYYVSNLKLQKILYFIQAEFLVTLGNPCFWEEIQAWAFGPVVPEVYQEYKKFGSSNIFIDYNINNIMESKKHEDLVKGIVDQCDNYSASDLVRFTHNQSPWLNAYQKYHNNPIRNEDIKEFFES